jgi:hypothetical protein
LAPPENYHLIHIACQEDIGRRLKARVSCETKEDGEVCVFKEKHPRKNKTLCTIYTVIIGMFQVLKP